MKGLANLPGLVFCLLVVVSGGPCALMVVQPALAQTAEASGHWWSSAVDQRLAETAGNDLEIRRSLAECPTDQREELEFLLTHMPTPDLQSLTAEYLLENIALACLARDSANWQVSDSIFLNDVLPYACVDETREAWRYDMRNRCWPLVVDCQSAGEAAQKLNRELFPLVQVRYSTDRHRPNQSPGESIQQSVASCTGLSILLVDACRSVGVPARVAGTPSWTGKRGNHTWVEIWDGNWHFMGAAEPRDEGLDHAWFTGDAARADDDQPAHRIYATSFAATGMHFPMVWARRDTSVPAINVTERYTNANHAIAPHLARVLISVMDANGHRVAVSVEVTQIASAATPTATLAGQGISRAGTADMNDVLEFELQRGREYSVKLSLEETTLTRVCKVDDQEQQLWRFDWNQQK